MSVEQAQIRIGGMHCAACVRRVDTALRGVPGVQSAAVEVGRAVVGYDAAQTDPAQLAAAVRRIGFEVED